MKRGFVKPVFRSLLLIMMTGLRNDGEVKLTEGSLFVLPDEGLNNPADLLQIVIGHLLQHVVDLFNVLGPGLQVREVEQAATRNRALAKVS
jgi:hypothetical protein